MKYLNPNRSLDCYALIKSSFSHLFRRFSVTMEPHCALKAAKHLFKNIGYYHHNANDRFGLKAIWEFCKYLFFIPPLEAASVARSSRSMSRLWKKEDCSMDICGITPEYVYRMWGGAVAIEEIAAAMDSLSHR